MLQLSAQYVCPQVWSSRVLWGLLECTPKHSADSQSCQLRVYITIGFDGHYIPEVYCLENSFVLTGHSLFVFFFFFFFFFCLSFFLSFFQNLLSMSSNITVGLLQPNFHYTLIAFLEAVDQNPFLCFSQNLLIITAIWYNRSTAWVKIKVPQIDDFFLNKL